MKKNIHLVVFSIFVLSLTVFPASAEDHVHSDSIVTTDLTRHESFIRQTFDLAISAAKKGNHPFGALLVYQNKVILTSENSVYTDRNVYGHAEINLMIQARREIPSEVLRESIMYTSTAPCMLCCASIWYRDIKRVVFGVSHTTFTKLTGYEDKSIHCDKFYQETGKPLEWIGPVLEEEGVRIYCYWPQDSFRSSLIKKVKELGTGNLAKTPEASALEREKMDTDSERKKYRIGGGLSLIHI